MALDSGECMHLDHLVMFHNVVSFRWINETMYKSPSEDTHKMIREQPSIFTEVCATYFIGLGPFLKYFSNIVPRRFPSSSTVMAK